LEEGIEDFPLVYQDPISIVMVSYTDGEAMIHWFQLPNKSDRQPAILR